MFDQTCWDQNFCPYYGGFFYCVLNSGSLLREAPLYLLTCIEKFVRTEDSTHQYMTRTCQFTLLCRIL